MAFSHSNVLLCRRNNAVDQDLRMWYSMRRLRKRPSKRSLLAIGLALPYPFATSMDGSTPAWIRALRMASARCCESARFCGIASVVGVAGNLQHRSRLEFLDLGGRVLQQRGCSCRHLGRTGWEVDNRLVENAD